jgi:dTDP-glucose 4,6-dehydratase
VAIFKGDIGLDSDISICICAYSVDTIIHLSAQTSVDTSLADPYGSSKANIIGTNVVLENAQKYGVKRFIHMSSAEVYGAAEPGPDGFEETNVVSPLNPYGASKAASEILITEYGNKGTMKTNIVRASNVYGPGQFPDSIPSLLFSY